jgi:hypothetical protein
VQQQRRDPPGKRPVQPARDGAVAGLARPRQNFRGGARPVEPVAANLDLAGWRRPGAEPDAHLHRPGQADHVPGRGGGERLAMRKVEANLAEAPFRQLADDARGRRDAGHPPARLAGAGEADHRPARRLGFEIAHRTSA